MEDVNCPAVNAVGSACPRMRDIRAQERVVRGNLNSTQLQMKVEIKTIAKYENDPLWGLT